MIEKGRNEIPYTTKEFQLIVRDTTTLPVEIEPFVGRQFTGPEMLVESFRAMENLPTEAFVVIHFNTRNEAVGMHVVSTGTLNASLAHPREVFRAAIMNLTRGIVCIHNHPSGDPAPSSEDFAINRRLKDCGELLGIPVIDFITIGTSGRYVSFADQGLL